MARSRPLAALRDPAWLTPARCRAYRNLFLVMTLAICAIWIAMSHHGIDPTGKPLGTDFVSFWIASRMALAGQAAEVYVPALHNAAERAAQLGGNGYVAFFYPPVFLLLCLPLGLLPYLVSLVHGLASPAWPIGGAYGQSGRKPGWRSWLFPPCSSISATARTPC